MTLVMEKIFGFLLAALAVELMLDGPDSLGLIHRKTAAVQHRETEAVARAEALGLRDPGQSPG